MSTAALFPTSLYTTDSDILGSTLTQSEWQQVAVEVEQIEAALGTSPQGTSATVAARFSGLVTAGTTVAFTSLTGTISETQHGAVTTAGTHPFSGLTGTFTAAQHGALGTAATHPFSGLTGTFTAAQHGALGTAATHVFSSLTNVYAAAVFTTLATGGAPSNSAFIVIPAGRLSAAPVWGILQEQYTGAYAVSAALQGVFVFGSPDQTTIQAHFRVSTLDGSNAASGDHLVSVIVGI